MATKSIVGILTTRLQLESFGFTRGMANAVKSVKTFQTAVRTNLVGSMSFAATKMKSLAVTGFGGIIAGATAALSSVAKFAAFIVGRFLVALSRLATALRSVATAVALVVAGTVAAFILLARSSSRSIDAIVKTATKLDIPIEKMKGLEIAASEAGISFEAFTTGLQRAARRIEEALSGAGVGVKPLEALGLKIEEIAALSPDKQILKIAAALEEVGRQGQKILIGFGLFDTEGVANILLTADALREAERFAKEMGITINKIDAAKIEAANDAAGRLKFTFRGLFDLLAIRSAPTIEAFSNIITKKLIEAGGVAEVLNLIIAKLGPITAAGIDFIAISAEKALRFISDVSDEAGKFFEKFEEDGKFSADRLFGPLLGILDAVKLAFVAVDAAILSILQSAAKLDEIQRKEGIIPFIPLIILRRLVLEKTKEQDAIRDSMLEQITTDAEASRARFVDLLDKVLDANLKTPTERIGLQFIEPLEEGINAIVPVLKEFSFATSVTSESLAEFLKLINESGGASAALTAKLLELIEANTNANTSLNETPKLLEEIIKKGEEMKEAAVEAATTVADVYAGIMVNAIGDASQSIAHSLLFAENAFIGLRDVALRMIEDIIAAFIRLAAFKFVASLFPGGGAISSAINAASGGIFGGGGGTELEGIEPSFDAPALKGGGGGVIINFFGDTMGDDAIREQVFKGITEAQPALTAAAVNETSNRAQRDPAFRRVFA